MNKDRKIQLIQKQIDDIEGLIGKGESQEFSKWNRITRAIILKIFGEESSNIKDFEMISYSLSICGTNTPKESFVRAHDNGLKEAKALLEAFIEEVDLFLDENEIDNDSCKVLNDKVFIVHGRDELAKVEVARLLEKLKLKPIILHEQASGGDTIIEKIERHSEVGFAVVLYTPCDIGGLNDNKNNLKFRARQNVVFEHGYLIGKIGRKNVSALVKGQIETPNDISGVVYTPMDDEGWKLQLAKELRQSGYDVDLNLLY